MRVNRTASWLVLAGLVGTAGAALGCRKTPPPQMVPEVAVQTLQPERVVLTTELPGRTSPFLVAEIRPQVNGLILKRLFQEGSEVKEGDALYQIDPGPYQAVLDQAQASLAAAEASLPSVQSRAERMKKLVGVNAVGQQEADEAEAAYQKAVAAVAAARAQVESARINLANTPIKAPISGRIGLSSVTVGALVTAHQPLALTTVQQMDPIYVDVTQSSADLLKLRASLESGRLKTDGARKVRLVLENGQAYPLEGRFQFRDVTVDPGTGAVTLRMVFPNPRQVLLPGMFVRAIVEDGVDEQGLLVMQEGVTRDAKGNATALVLDPQNKVEQRTLVVDRAIGNRWHVAEGLKAGDRIIVEGVQKVRPGAVVKAVPYAAQPAKQ